MSDGDKFKNCIAAIDGTGNSKCNIAGALDYAGKLLDAVRATYGDNAKTNIVLFSGADNTVGISYTLGRYSDDPDGNGAWANDSCCNATYWMSLITKSRGHSIYVLSANRRGYVTFGDFVPLEESYNNYLRRFLKDLASGDGYYWDLDKKEDVVPAMESVAGKITAR